MLKWLLLCAFLVNLLAFYWLSDQSVRPVESPSAWGEPSVGVVLLSELNVIPPERPLSTAEAAIKEVVPNPEAFVGRDQEELAIGKAVEDKNADFPQTDGREIAVVADEKNQAGAMAEKIESSRKQKLLTPRLEAGIRLPCVQIGRFDTEQDALSLLEKLEADVGVTAKLQRVSEGLERYLVYMMPFETKLKAKQQQSILKKDGIRSSLYYKGELENGLSLGFFASKENASRKYNSLLDAGYRVEIKTMVSKLSRYWLELDRDESVKLSQLFWRDLGREYPSVIGKPSECTLVSELVEGK